jgi:hypothetical protein
LHRKRNRTAEELDLVRRAKNLKIMLRRCITRLRHELFGPADNPFTNCQDQNLSLDDSTTLDDSTVSTISACTVSMRTAPNPCADSNASSQDETVIPVVDASVDELANALSKTTLNDTSLINEADQVDSGEEEVSDFDEEDNEQEYRENRNASGNARLTNRQKALKADENLTDLYITSKHTVQVLISHPLLHPFRNSRVLEPCNGTGAISDTLLEEGFTSTVICRDKVFPVNGETHDYLIEQLGGDFYDILLTNPPFSKKYEFIQLAFETNKPFALLLPLDILVNKRNEQEWMKQKKKLDIILPQPQKCFTKPDGTKVHTELCGWFMGNLSDEANGEIRLHPHKLD